MNAIAPTERAVARWENEGGSIAHSVREQFPGLANNWHYLDTGATAQKPQVVLDAMMRWRRGLRLRPSGRLCAFGQYDSSV